MKGLLVYLISGLVVASCHADSTGHSKKNKIQQEVTADISIYPPVDTSEGLILVEDGKALGKIIVPANPTDQVMAAALKIQEYILASSGVTLQVAHYRDETMNNLHVGLTTFMIEKEVEIEGLDEDGYLLKQLDKSNYIILGGSDWGTEFGAYEFLERFVGVRWLMPSRIGTVIPKIEKLVLPSRPIRENPVYISRQLSPINILRPTALGRWGRFNRARGRIKFHHNLRNLFSPDDFAQTHPEFYSEIEGRRQIPLRQDRKWQPNFSAPQIVDMAAEKIIRYFNANPDEDTYSLGVNDGRDLFDQSRLSLARRSGKDNFLGLEHVSDDYFRWANEVAEKVTAVFPDKQFGTLAYNNIAEPPSTKIHSSIVPFITYERMRWADDETRQFGHELNRRWLDVSNEIGWYDYVYGRAYLVPRVWFHTMAKYLKWGADNDVKYYYAELYPNWGDGPKAWVLTKLLWNPDRDVDELLNEWYVTFAGAQAAPKLKEFYALWEKFWTEDCYKYNWSRGRGHYLTTYRNPVYLKDVPESYITRSDQLMNDAFKLAKTNDQKQRVKVLVEMWELYKEFLKESKKSNLENLFANEHDASNLKSLLRNLRKSNLHALSIKEIDRWIGR